MRRIRMVLVTAVALSACGSSGEAEKDGDTHVASLATPEASTAAAKKEKADPPRARLDTTQEEYDALLVPYQKCLKRNGLTFKEGKLLDDQSARSAAPPSKKVEKQVVAYKSCEKQFYPLPPWEKDPANPGARDFAAAVVKCLKNKGLKDAEVSEDGLGTSFGDEQNDSRTIDMRWELTAQCEREVAAASK